MCHLCDGYGGLWLITHEHTNKQTEKQLITHTHTDKQMDRQLITHTDTDKQKNKEDNGRTYLQKAGCVDGVGGWVGRLAVC